MSQDFGMNSGERTWEKGVLIDMRKFWKLFFTKALRIAESSVNLQALKPVSSLVTFYEPLLFVLLLNPFMNNVLY